MSGVTIERTPAFGDVWREQLRVTALAVRRETLAALALLTLMCLAGVVVLRNPAVAEFLDLDAVTDPRLDPGISGFAIWGVLAALVFPLLVWRGERPYGDSPLWALPVDHRAHIHTKLVAGWLCLMGLLSVALVLVASATVAGGGGLGVDEVREVIIDGPAFFAGEAGATRSVPWTTRWWEWVVPFTAATATYLLSSALLLGMRRPFVWAVVLWMLVGAAVGVGDFYEIAPVGRVLETTEWFVGAQEFSTGFRLSTGEYARGWWRLPSFGLWATTASVWIGLGLVGVLAASARGRDH